MNDPRFLAFGITGPGRPRRDMDDNFGKILAYVCAFGALVGIAALASTCAPGPEKAVETLRVQGFTDIRITDTDRMFVGWSGCSDKDGVAHHATATNPRGERVTLTVARRQNDGQMGAVEKSSNAHGLCFYVRHDNGGAAWWEPEELTVASEHPAVTLLRALQWSGGDDVAMCPDCKAPKYPRGIAKHGADCRIDALLAKEEGR